ncbi:MAG: hypothetical protein IH936_12470 [Acidobacteria bacterium]|nr:hypothetical protein [Acidobacteriota bacterium]
MCPRPQRGTWRALARGQARWRRHLNAGRRSVTSAISAASGRRFGRMPSSEVPEQKLMARVVARDSSALTELFDGHAPVVLGMLVKMRLADDLASTRS